MATVLLVEDQPDLVLYEARLLEAAGHRVVRCFGGPTPFAACTMLRTGSCALPDSVNLIVFDCGMFGPLRHRSYRGIHLLRAYRSHPRYGRLPMLVISESIPEGLDGRGPIESIPKFTQPAVLVDTVEGLLSRSRAALATT